MAVTIHRAMRGSLGRVIRGDAITEAEAVVEYAAGGDIVVCGRDVKDTSPVAKRIAAACGPYLQQPPHASAGPYSLPHYQPDPRPEDEPERHVFYETVRRKAAVNP